MRVLFIVSIPSPYRVLFFNELGKYCDLTVIYERHTASDRNLEWKAYVQKENYRSIYLKGSEIANDNSFCIEVIRYLKKEKWDYYIIGCYSSFTSMLAIFYFNMHKIPFILNTDGGFVPDSEPRLKTILKKYFIGTANHWLSTSEKASDYLVHYGANRNNVFKYPFTSLLEKDIKEAFSIGSDEKRKIRKELGITEKKILLSVGEITQDSEFEKQVNIFFVVSEMITTEIGIYILGDASLEECAKWKNRKKFKNIHFVALKEMQELARYCVAADIFVLLTHREGSELYINVAMSFGLPIITTKECHAGMDFIKDGSNGYIIESDNAVEAVNAINEIFLSDVKMHKMGIQSREAIESYSMEKLIYEHMAIYKNYCKQRIGVKEKYIILTVGQFIFRKGFDLLINVSKNLSSDFGIYFVGGKPSPKICELAKSIDKRNIHFIDFKRKDELKEYYLAADLFILPTREDVWGLVINEAMGYALPVITTDKCLAGTELIKEGINGYIVPIDNTDMLSQGILKVMSNDMIKMGLQGRSVIKKYSIEEMSKKHIEILNIISASSNNC